MTTIPVAVRDHASHLAIQQSERDLGRAGTLAFATIHAAAGQMQGSGQMPRQVAPGVRRRFNPGRLRLFGDAALAEAHRADLPAGMAARARVPAAASTTPAARRGSSPRSRTGARPGCALPGGSGFRLAHEVIGECRFPLLATTQRGATLSALSGRRRRDREPRRRSARR